MAQQLRACHAALQQAQPPQLLACAPQGIGTGLAAPSHRHRRQTVHTCARLGRPPLHKSRGNAACGCMCNGQACAGQCSPARPEPCLAAAAAQRTSLRRGRSCARAPPLWQNNPPQRPRVWQCLQCHSAGAPGDVLLWQSEADKIASYNFPCIAYKRLCGDQVAGVVMVHGEWPCPIKNQVFVTG